MKVDNVLLGVIIVLKLNRSGSIILITLTLLMKIVWSFVWRKFSSVGREEWYDEMKNRIKLKLGDAHVTPRHIQEVKASKLGMPKDPLLHQQKYRVIFQETIFLLLHMICVIIGASVIFYVQFHFALFAVVYDCILAFFWRETRFVVIA